MKSLHIILLTLVLSASCLAGENGPSDWEYGSFVYSANIPGDDTTQATICGPAFPDGIRLLRDYKTLAEFKAALIRIVDSLNATSEPVLPLVKKGKRQR